MQSRIYFLTGFLLLSFSLHAQPLVVYTLNELQIDSAETITLLSLSEIYPISEHPDSLPIPRAEDEGWEEARYKKLDSVYRERFFTGTKIQENDSVFIYDFANDKLVSLAVKQLLVVACLNIYSDPSDAPFSIYDYMIGFKIEKNLLIGFGDYYSTAFAYIGKENPFDRAQMKPVVWKKIDENDFPSRAITIIDTLWLRNTVKSNVHTSEFEGLQFFTQDYLSSGNLRARRLLVIDSKTKETVCERIFYDHESASPAPLNLMQPEYGSMIDQWTGKLFKNKPPVIFGFEYLSFGCPRITFLNKTDGDIYINCDNRH